MVVNVRGKTKMKKLLQKIFGEKNSTPKKKLHRSTSPGITNNARIQVLITYANKVTVITKKDYSELMKILRKKIK